MSQRWSLMSLFALTLSLAATAGATDGLPNRLNAAKASVDRAISEARQKSNEVDPLKLLWQPYGPEKVPGNGKSLHDVELALQAKRYYWQGVKKTLERENRRRKDHLLKRVAATADNPGAALGTSENSLGRERSAVRLILSDIGFDFAAFSSVTAGNGDNAAILKRKSDLFRSLALLNNN